MSEASIQRAIIKYCKELGLLPLKLASPSNRGVTDLIVIGHRKVVFIEVKAPGGKLTVLQKRFMDMLFEFGVDAYVVRDIEDGKALVDFLFPLVLSD